MTTTKPREWTIEWKDFQDTTIWHVTGPPSCEQYERFKVIEKSAYDALAQQLEEMKNELAEQCRINGIGGERELKLMAERDELQAENLKYRQEMDKITQGIPSEWAYAILRKERDALAKPLTEIQREFAIEKESSASIIFSLTGRLQDAEDQLAEFKKAKGEGT